MNKVRSSLHNPRTLVNITSPTTIKQYPMDVLIFKTSVASPQEVSRIHPLLTSLAEIRQYNFDLEDCDNILRVVSSGIEPQTINHMLQIAGFTCEELPY
jgi:hypothetical protein